MAALSQHDPWAWALSLTACLGVCPYVQAGVTSAIGHARWLAVLTSPSREKGCVLQVDADKWF